MQRKTTIINQQKLFRDLPAWAELQDRKGSFEMHWELSDEFGKGFLYLAMFRPGLMLGLGDYYLRETISTFPRIKTHHLLSISLFPEVWRALLTTEVATRLFICLTQSRVLYPIDRNTSAWPVLGVKIPYA